MNLSRPGIFLSLFFLAGISDVLDGFIARRLHVSSTFGSKLDTIGDVFMISALAAFGFYRLGLDAHRFIPYMVLIAGFRLLAFLTHVVRFKDLNAIHTYVHKWATVMVFFAVFVIYFEPTWLFVYLWLMHIVAITGAVEEWLIHLLLKTSDASVKTLYHLNVRRKVS